MCFPASPGRNALEERPDAIIFSGDLTLNGSPVSHRELAGRLKTLDDAGIPVLVIPGNHDISIVSYRFTGDGVKSVEGTDGAAFREIYQEPVDEDLLGKAIEGSGLTGLYLTTLQNEIGVDHTNACFGIKNNAGHAFFLSPGDGVSGSNCPTAPKSEPGVQIKNILCCVTFL